MTLPEPSFEQNLERVLDASDLFRSVLSKQPELRERLRDDDGADWAPPLLDDANFAQWGLLLRRFRYASSARIIYRDVMGLDSIDDTLRRQTLLADVCLQTALAALEQRMVTQHGEVIGASSGAPVGLVVFALGKLGGEALNFSSDIDLIIGYEENGESNGARPLSAEPYFTRLSQQLIKLLDEVTAEGFVFRVDMRLRPFGQSGRLVWSFPAMETYYQREGRDWERYAWQKARVVAGDFGAGAEFLKLLRPFVYRRYLDFSALEGVRTMKDSIQQEVARKDRGDDIKLGPGGIREVEFLVQALQLIRGGREPLLRTPRFQEALNALVETHQLDAETASSLRSAYRFLRIVENRVQMLRDEQTHVLPSNEADRLRIARGMGYSDWSALLSDLEPVRAVVQQEFNGLMAPQDQPETPDDLKQYWNALPEGGDGKVLAGKGFRDAHAADAALRDFTRGPAVRQLNNAAKARLDRVMPVMLEASAHTVEPNITLRRLLSLMQAILKRSAYIALLDEQPSALQRLVDVVTESALMSGRLTLHPMLLDELLDSRVVGLGVEADEFAASVASIVFDGDIEAALAQLNELRQIASFRAAMAFRDGRQTALQTTQQLAFLAQTCVAKVVEWVEAEMREAHGDVPGGAFAAIGYGSVGAQELSFGSDLDLVFLYDAAPNAMSVGARSVDAGRYYARVAQKVVSYLGVQTAAGRLFEVDMRLRPDGAKGLLVSTIQSFSAYQRERAWTWEHQALVRARALCGDAKLLEAFNAVRAEFLQRDRDESTLQKDIIDMRRKMRKELDRSSEAQFDLKQGRGGLVDLEFWLQFQVLKDSATHPDLLSSTRTIDLLQLTNASSEVVDAYENLLKQGINCTLDRRKRIVARTDDLKTTIDVIKDATSLLDDAGA